MHTQTHTEHMLKINNFNYKQMEKENFPFEIWMTERGCSNATYRWMECAFVVDTITQRNNRNGANDLKMLLLRIYVTMVLYSLTCVYVCVRKLKVQLQL